AVEAARRRIYDPDGHRIRATGLVAAAVEVRGHEVAFAIAVQGKRVIVVGILLEQWATGERGDGFPELDIERSERGRFVTDSPGADRPTAAHERHVHARRSGLEPLCLLARDRQPIARNDIGNEDELVLLAKLR